jgi:hypothetical protein
MDPVMAGYRRDIDAARRRLADRQRRILRDPRFGDIEYTQWGEGPAMLLSHPLLGGFDMMTGFAQTYSPIPLRRAAPGIGWTGDAVTRPARPGTTSGPGSPATPRSSWSANEWLLPY